MKGFVLGLLLLVTLVLTSAADAEAAIRVVKVNRPDAPISTPRPKIRVVKVNRPAPAAVTPTAHPAPQVCPGGVCEPNAKPKACGPGTCEQGQCGPGCPMGTCRPGSTCQPTASGYANHTVNYAGPIRRWRAARQENGGFFSRWRAARQSHGGLFGFRRSCSACSG